MDKKMERDLATGVAIDISECPSVGEGLFDITELWLDGVNPSELYYCHVPFGKYVRSIGRHRNDTKKIVASLDGRFRDHPWWISMFYLPTEKPR